MILLDTNLLIHYLKGNEPATSRIRTANPADVAVPSVVVYEIEYGTLRIASARRRTMLDRIISALKQAPFDLESARESARIRYDLETNGQVIGPMDLMIAGTAVSRGAILATTNAREFSRVKGLRLEDWTR